MAKNWAIVVGVNAYKSIGDLKYANRDAEAMRDFFNEAKFDRVICFADELTGAMLPSFTELEDFLQDQFTADPLPLAPGDNCWFFFAGHGKRIDDCDYLLPIDYNPRMANPEKRAISVNFVREALLKSGADNVILLLDACRTEGDRSEGMGIGEAQPGAITIFSCQRHRKAYEIEALQQGAFTWALLEALRMPRERNCATVERLDLYLRDRVPQICRQHDKPEQVPMTLVEPRQKSYLILLPQFATEKDVDTLRMQAFQAFQLDKNLDLAEHLWGRVLAMGYCPIAIRALQDIAVQRRLTFNASCQKSSVDQSSNQEVENCDQREFHTEELNSDAETDSQKKTSFEDKGFSELFESFFKTSNSKDSSQKLEEIPQKIKGEDLRLDLKLEFQEAVFGAEREVSISHLQTCKNCLGNGIAPNSPLQKDCVRCMGQGKVTRKTSTPFGSFSELILCPICKGQENFCKICGSDGRSQMSKKFKITIPSGVDNETRLRVTGEGDAGIRGGQQEIYMYIFS